MKCFIVLGSGYPKGIDAFSPSRIGQKFKKIEGASWSDGEVAENAVFREVRRSGLNECIALFSLVDHENHSSDLHFANKWPRTRRANVSEVISWDTPDHCWYPGYRRQVLGPGTLYCSRRTHQFVVQVAS